MKILILLTFTITVLCSCSANAVGKEENISYETQKAEKITYTSKIIPDNCYLCGSGNSLMPYYAQFDSVGVICLNTWNIIDSRIRTFDDYGNPIKTSGSQTSILNCGADECHFSSGTSSNRIKADVTVSFGKGSVITPEKLCNELCQPCLDMVLKSCIASDKPLKESHDAVLVDFQEKTIYPITYYTGFFIRDYFIHIDQKDNEYSIIMVHCPSTEV